MSIKEEKQNKQNAETHGETRNKKPTKEYRAWCSMVQRCHNPNRSDYPRYGGRGVRVSDEWRSSFEDFLQDVGRAPSNQHSLERINNSRGYVSGNVKWATTHEQVRNRKSNIKVYVDGNLMILKDACRVLGLPYGTIQRRITVHGWSKERALNEPINIIRRRKEKSDVRHLSIVF